MKYEVNYWFLFNIKVKVGLLNVRVESRDLCSM